MIENDTKVMVLFVTEKIRTNDLPEDLAFLAFYVNGSSMYVLVFILKSQ